MELLYFVTDGMQSLAVGEFGVRNREFCGLKDRKGALDEARALWRKHFGRVRPHVHRIDVKTRGKKISEVWEWKPGDDDYVWLAEQAMERSRR